MQTHMTNTVDKNVGTKDSQEPRLAVLQSTNSAGEHKWCQCSWTWGIMPVLKVESSCYHYNKKRFFSFFFFLETGSHYVAQADLELAM
jgi:hypothetical protein